MSNWKNVNNWHWTSKNCLTWAQSYFGDKLANVNLSADGMTVTTTSDVQVNGDVDLNQRKGKVLAMFDVAITVGWRGTSNQGVEAFGSIHIPEVAHDTDIDDYVFDVTTNNESSDTRPLKELVRTRLTKTLRSILAQFADDLIAGKSHKHDVYIEPKAYDGSAEGNNKPKDTGPIATPVAQSFATDTQEPTVYVTPTPKIQRPVSSPASPLIKEKASSSKSFKSKVKHRRHQSGKTKESWWDSTLVLGSASLALAGALGWSVWRLLGSE